MKKIILFLLLCGCASVGHETIVKDDLVAQIKKGETTKEEVRSILGVPFKINFTDVGEDVWEYFYSKSSVRPASFIPCIGVFAGGADTETHTLTIRFFKDGIVKDIGKGQMKGGGGSIRD